MNTYSLKFKIILQIFLIIIFFSTLHARNLDKFNKGNYISDYFSGILLLNNNQYDQSYRYLRKLDGLEDSHKDFPSKYLFSLVNTEKFNEAFIYSRKLEKKNLDSFESDLIIGVYFLKNKKYNLANKYFNKLKNKDSRFILNNFLSNSLVNWTSFKNMDLAYAIKRMETIDKRFENLNSIQNVFLHCFFDSKKTEQFFENLSLNQNIDFSRYNYFYANYLTKKGKIDQAKEIITSSLELYPRNLLLNQYQFNLTSGNFKRSFNCQNLSHIVAEIFYVTANALSSQNIFASSNFYLNLAKYLNQDFIPFNALLAENYFKTEDFPVAKKIYEDLSDKGDAFFWHSAKQNAKILIKEKKRPQAIKLISKSYNKLLKKNIYETYDYAVFLKNNDQYKNSIKFYTEIIKKIDKQHPLYPKVMDGRGVSFERLGEWDKAEKDLLLSLNADPDQAYVINYLAYSWIEQGIKIEKALEMLKKANDLKSNDPYIIDSLGWALFKLKKYEDAKYYLQSAVKLMPADPVVNDHYGDVLWMNGDKIQARYYWNYVLNLKETEKDMRDDINNKLISGL